MNKMDQDVWCIASEKLFESGKWTGVKTSDLDFYLNLFNQYGEFRRRGDLETDPNFKQIIPQVLLQVDDKYLIHQNTVHAGEQRLHHTWPMFVGGHVERIDDTEGNLLETATWREFREEANYQGQILSTELVGLIYIENDNSVNSVHIGVVYRFVGDTQEIQPTEAEVGEMQFVDIDYLNSHIDELDHWSQTFLPILNQINPSLALN